MKDLKKRIQSVKNKYRSAHNGSFNLEQYMHNKQIIKGDNSHTTPDKAHFATHISIASNNKLT